MNGYAQGYLEKSSGILGAAGGSGLGLAAAKRLGLLDGGYSNIPEGILSVLAVLGASSVGGSLGSIVEDAADERAIFMDKLRKNQKEKRDGQEEKEAQQVGGPDIGALARRIGATLEGHRAKKDSDTPMSLLQRLRSGTRIGTALKRRSDRSILDLLQNTRTIHKLPGHFSGSVPLSRNPSQSTKTLMDHIRHGSIPPGRVPMMDSPGKMKLK
jgi:hypothetical protein